ncbi:hypothetical protein PSTG_10092 [Puccinia striiformis f. sp. tritici PST-78]|uniref:Uncharacterized protein n=1 Tax=Puccinia striiformis f. sp. tritici PST-78 TaxID=1165861 RepID=A0A0L0VCH1_9BASI|nr:hypothetical protein PSTG_10092 [Puccinia striiformis f. sp. tritici PST-78]
MKCYVSRLLSLSHLTYSALLIITATPPQCKAGIQTERIPFDLNKLPQEELATDTLCSDNLIAPCLVAQKSVDPNKELDEEDVAEILLSLQQTKPPSPVVEQLNSSSGLNRGGSGLWLSAKDVTPGGSSSVAGGHPQDSFLTNSCLSSSSRKRKKATLTSNKSPKSTLIKGRNHWIFATEENLLRENHSRGEDQFSSQYQRMNAYPKPQTADIVNKEIENLDVVKLNNDQKTDEVFNVYNWDFIRGDTGGRTPDYYQNKLFQFLNSCRVDPDLKQPFFLERDQTGSFLGQLMGRGRRELRISDVKSQNWRKQPLLETCLSISDNKINLNGYSIFSKELLGGMMERLKVNEEKHEELVVKIQVDTVLEFVENVTKVAHLLTIVYLSVFKEHESEILRVDQVEHTLEFLTKLWLDIEEGKIQSEWAKKLTKILNFQKGDTNVYNMVTKKALGQTVASHFLKYWLVSTRGSLPGGNHHQPAENHPGILELINKIIFYSNYKSITRDITN